jgi:hypothetical protein
MDRFLVKYLWKHGRVGTEVEARDEEAAVEAVCALLGTRGFIVEQVLPARPKRGRAGEGVTAATEGPRDEEKGKST